MGPPPRKRLSGALLAGIIGLVCVVALVVGLGAFWLNRDGGGDEGPMPIAGQLTAEYPTAPSVAWQVGVNQLNAYGIVSPNPTDSQYERVGFSHDDRTIVTLLKQQRSDRGGRLLGVDTVDGRSWLSDDVMWACADRIDGGRTACYDGTGVHIIDVGDGSIERSGPLPVASPYGIGYAGESAYVRSFGPAGLTVYEITPDGRGWERSVAVPEQTVPTGDAAALLMTDVLFVSSVGGHTVVLRLADGEVLFEGLGHPNVQGLPDGSVAVHSISGSNQSGLEYGPVVVVHPDGRISEIQGESVAAPAVFTADYADTVFVDGRPVDLADPGSPRWTTSRTIATGQVDLAAPDQVVLVDGLNSELVVADAADGSVLWSAETRWTSADTVSVTDGQRLILPTPEGAVEARDLATGAQVWSVRATDLTIRPQAQAVGTAVLVPMGDRLVAVNPAGITGFDPTGGPAYPPGYTPSADGNGESGADDEITVTRCDSVPEFRAEQFLTDTAGLKVNFRVTTGCSDGDLVNGRDVEITIGDGGDLVAGGIFDFSGAPLVIPPPDDGSDDVSVELTFPPGSFLRLPDTLDDSVDDLEVTCRRGSGTGPSSVTVRREATGPSLTASAPAVGEGETDLAVDYLSALRRQANADRAFIEEHLDDRWVAQLSSKRPGLRADGKVWDEQAILEEFLELRLRFSDVRLLYSDEWPVFSEPGWWVTVAAQTFSGPEAALSWCRAEGFGRDHCYAKLISTTAGPQNTTRYLN